MTSPNPRIAEVFADHIDVVQRTAELGADIQRAADMLTACLVAGRTILLCGNGGSAADAQHLAGEWVGRYLLERRGLPAIALHSDGTTITAVGNDYGFEEIYARQVEAFGRPGDVLIAMTTSGNSENVLRAAKRAKELGVAVIGMTGHDGGKLRPLCDICLAIPSPVTARVQEMHITVGHLLCDLSEQGWVSQS